MKKTINFLLFLFKNHHYFKLVIVQEAAEFLGVTARSIINYIRSKEIEAIKVGKSWYIKKPSLDSFSIRYGFAKIDVENKVVLDKPKKSSQKQFTEKQPTKIIIFGLDSKKKKSKNYFCSPSE